MKIRNGFVSNSSSSSFVLKCRNIKYGKVQMIIEMAEKHEWSWTEDRENMLIEFSTCMDNFGLREFIIDDMEVDSKYVTTERNY